MYEMELINTTGVPVTLYTIYGTAWVLRPNPLTPSPWNTRWCATRLISTGSRRCR